MTQTGANKRLLCCLAISAGACFLEKAQTPPHGWQIVLLTVAVTVQLCTVYRAFIDTSDGEAKDNQQAAAPTTGDNPNATATDP